MSSNYRLIAKNTLFLYVRLLIMALLGLVTSRILLQAFGVRGFGLYSVVGGLVLMLSFLQNSMAGATQRFLNFEMGRGNLASQKEVFSTCLLIHKWLSLILIVFAETIGLWFLNNMMNIHDDEILVANIVYQLSIFTFSVAILNTPYRAALIAHERMDYIAYLSIFEIVMKFILALCLYYEPFERIVFYSLCVFFVNVLIFFFYKTVAKKEYEECDTKEVIANRKTLKRIGMFTSWTLFESVGNLSHSHGVNLAVNIFYGLAVNAALGIANQVAGLVRQFIQSFMSALNPQIVKNYAMQDIQSMQKLVVQGCKMGGFLVALITLPIIIETPYIIRLWLKDVPNYTVIFVRLNMIVILAWSISSPLIVAQWATGNIRNFQLTMGGISLIHLPLTLMFFKLGFNPPVAIFIYVALEILKQFCRIKFVCKSIGMRESYFFYEVVMKSVCMVALASIAPIVLHNVMPQSFVSSVIVVGVCLFGVVGFFYNLALHKNERVVVKAIFIEKMSIVNNFRKNE